MTKVNYTVPVVICKVSLDIVNSFVFSCNSFSNSIKNKNQTIVINIILPVIFSSNNFTSSLATTSSPSNKGNISS